MLVAIGHWLAKLLGQERQLRFEVVSTERILVPSALLGRRHLFLCSLKTRWEFVKMPKNISLGNILSD